MGKWGNGEIGRSVDAPRAPFADRRRVDIWSCPITAHTYQGKIGHVVEPVAYAGGGRGLKRTIRQAPQ